MTFYWISLSSLHVQPKYWGIIIFYIILVILDFFIVVACKAKVLRNYIFYIILVILRTTWWEIFFFYWISFTSLNVQPLSAGKSILKFPIVFRFLCRRWTYSHGELKKNKTILNRYFKDAECLVAYYQEIINFKMF